MFVLHLKLRAKIQSRPYFGTDGVINKRKPLLFCRENMTKGTDPSKEQTSRPMCGL